MEREKVVKIGTEAAKIYFDYNCAPEQAIAKAKELYESKEREEKELKRVFRMLYDGVKEV